MEENGLKEVNISLTNGFHPMKLDQTQMLFQYYLEIVDKAKEVLSPHMSGLIFQA